MNGGTPGAISSHNELGLRQDGSASNLCEQSSRRIDVRFDEPGAPRSAFNREIYRLLAGGKVRNGWGYAGKGNAIGKGVGATVVSRLAVLLVIPVMTITGMRYSGASFNLGCRRDDGRRHLLRRCCDCRCACREDGKHSNPQNYFRFFKARRHGWKS